MEKKYLYAKENNAHFINVMQVDGIYVKEALIQNDVYDESEANHNSKSIAKIMKSAPARCTIYFPGGIYHFNGSAENGRATVATSAAMQSFAGDGMNATFIREKSQEVETVFLMAHDRCILSDMSITSADMAGEYKKEWEDFPHGTAVAIDCYYSDAPFSAECIFQNLTINSSGNSLVTKAYYRPFEIAFKVRGNWLDPYFHSIWMTDVFTGFDVSEGSAGGFAMGGSIQIIDVNYYMTLDPNGDAGSKLHWSIFYRSRGLAMEQLEILHCMYIGSQFIYVDIEEGESHKPAYDMVIDHNYINTVKLDAGSDETKSGIYMNLPSIEGAYSRDVRFTNNSCSGRSPGSGAFFYVKGAVRGITFADNDVSSGGADKCVYIRSTDLAAPGNEVGVRDVKIAGNYFRNYQNPITVGGDGYDPSRTGGKAKDDFHIDRVIVSNNQIMGEIPEIERIARGGIHLSKCRSVSITGNTQCPTQGYALTLYECERVAITGNSFESFLDGTRGKAGVWLNRCRGVSVGTNAIYGFSEAIAEIDCENVLISSNITG